MMRLALCSLVFVMAGCTVQRDLNEAYCGDDLDCSAIPGTACVRDYCVPIGRVDAGPDARPDADPDTGPEACDADEACYTGATSTLNIGTCRAGIRPCVDGFFGSCMNEVTPQAETCNMMDDDCNGTVDDVADLTTDANCGVCGVSCGEGFGCCGGASGFLCRNFLRDPEFCGMCGACGDIAQPDCCDDGCTNMDDDVLNCGACGNVCDTGDLCCGGACVDPQSDAEHCSECGMSCSGDSCCGGVCAAAESETCVACDPACEGTATCFSGRCVETSTDPRACGDTFADCGDGLCCDGACVPRTDEQCTACGVSCGAGSLCCGRTCVPNDANNCATCGTICSGSATQDICCPDRGCADLDAPGSCGACGNVCTGGSVCLDRSCCGDSPGEAVCGGRCVNTRTDRANCGSCGRVCTLLLSCRAGTCSLT